MFRRLLLCGLAMSALVAADAPNDLAAKFGAMEGVQDISLSPDGGKVAYLAPKGEMGNALYTVNLADGTPRMALATDGKPLSVLSCSWISDARLLCKVFSAQKGVADVPFVNASKLIAVNADGSGLKVVSQREQQNALYFSGYGGDVIDWSADRSDSVMLTRWFVPEAKIGSLVEKKAEGLGVERVDTLTGKRDIIETAKREGYEYISDQYGAVRVMGTRPYDLNGYSKPVESIFFRANGSREWRPLASYDTQTEEGFNPLAVDRDKNIVYGLRKLDGRKAIYTLALDGSGKETLVYANPSVDVDNVVRVGRDHRVVGASYVIDKRQVHYFDPEIERMTKALSRALPGQPAVYVADTSADGSKLLIWAGSDLDPGGYYVFDKTAKKLNKILLVRAELDGMKLAAVKPIQYRAGDGTMVPAYLTLPPGSSGKGLPAIVMPHGGPNYRDEWGFDWLPQYYAARGYAVIQPNYRGSSGYGDNWLKGNAFLSWRVAINDVVDAGKWLVSEGIADPAKLAIVGWSYGGYAALQSSAISPATFKAVVAIAPVTDIRQLSEQYRYTSNFIMLKDYLLSDSARAGSPVANVSAITAPVMLAHGDMDQNVWFRQSESMAAKLKAADKKYLFLQYPGLEHSLRTTTARTDLLSRSDAFLREQMGMK